ncbi:hypothetical protein VB779_08905 [Haloarculaceae archaeon H-GB11]|nr:hypothetical protein [Haloarculaceae archaeon H-GB11]
MDSDRAATGQRATERRSVGVASTAPRRRRRASRTGRTLEARRDALLASYEYLQEHPEAKKSDFLQDVFPEHPAEYQTAEGWWNAIQPALAKLPGVDPPKERGHIWHFLGG